MKNRNKLLLLSLFSLSTMALEAQPVFENQDKSFEERTKLIMKQMTLEEKISQLSNSSPAITRLGIPHYDWWNECLHGHGRAGKSTVFPQSIGLAATFDPDLIFEMATAISDEARAYYTEAIKRDNRGLYNGLTFYSPNVNIYRDPRWGRGQETYGEDPYLTAQMGVAFVKGLQGNDEEYLKTAACAKHYAVHSGPEEFRHSFDAIASDRDMYETYLPAFKALVKEGNVKSVMGAYNRTNGEACCASPTLLQKILKDDWGFDGYLTSDCGAIVDIYKYHKLCKTKEEAAAMAVKAGMNLNCGGVYKVALMGAIKQKLITEKDIDLMLHPLLLTRFELGMFDKPEDVPYNYIKPTVVDSRHHKNIAYQTALKSLVMLENSKGLLPLNKDKIKSIYVTGPNASNTDALIGNYFGVSDKLTTFLEGIVNRAPLGVQVQYKQGVMLDKANTNPIDWGSGTGSQADAVVACVGLTWLLEGEEGEAIASAQKGDMENNSIPPAQIEYLRKVKSKMKDDKSPLIVVVTGGCPVQLNEIREIADALIYAWYPGEAGGYALADVIFGNANPSGRTPMTFVESLEQLPPFTDYSMEGRTYKYMKHKPLYPFGYGLSYSKFEYSNLKVTPEIKAGEQQRVSVTIKNSSQYDGEEVVQLYITDCEASVPVPIRRLAAFKRVAIKAGESCRISLTVNSDMMSVITDDTKRKVEEGKFTISVGGGQPVDVTPSYVEGNFNVKGNKFIEL